MANAKICDRCLLLMPSLTDTFSLQSNLRILIVEDDPVMRLGLEHLLSEYPQLQIIAQVEDGYSGIEAALELKPDFAIVDIGLPQLDGILVQFICGFTQQAFQHDCAPNNWSL